MDNSNWTNWVIIGAVAVIVIAGGWWLFTGRNMGDNSPTSTSTPTGGNTNTGGTGTTTGTAGRPTATTTPAGETVTVQNQTAGSSVAVSMNLTRETWVAVRDDRSILGAGRFAAGATSGSIKLLRPTQAGRQYQVVVYADDGDKKFDFKVDALVSGVSTSFTAQ